MTLTTFPLPPKVHTEPTQKGSNQDSSYGDQHLWLRAQPVTSTINDQPSHRNGDQNPHACNKGTQHHEDCSDYPSDHESRVGNPTHTSKGTSSADYDPTAPGAREGLTNPLVPAPHRSQQKSGKHRGNAGSPGVGASILD